MKPPPWQREERRPGAQFLDSMNIAHNIRMPDGESTQSRTLGYVRRKPAADGELDVSSVQSRPVDFATFDPGPGWVPVPVSDPDSRCWIAAGPAADVSLVGARLTLTLSEDRL